MDEVNYIAKFNRLGISVLDAFIFDEYNNAECSKCNKKFDNKDKVGKYQHYFDKHT